MKLLPRSVTVIGLIIAVAAVLMDPQITALMAPLFGAEVATKVAAIGALIAALGRALVPPSVTPAPGA